MNEVSKIVERYIGTSTLRDFAASLIERLGDQSMTHATVINWRTGKTEPSTDFLCLLVMRYRDWRFQFALECLAAKHPDVWGWPEGGVWKAGREIERRKTNVSGDREKAEIGVSE